MHWRYKPAKQDGRNEERRNKFIEEYLSIKAEVRVPQVAAEVEGFLNELLKIARARIQAEITVLLLKMLLLQNNFVSICANKISDQWGR